ncbi:MAG: hypothetical protein Kow00124_06180 [Anaerolineae bacterium]
MPPISDDLLGHAASRFILLDGGQTLYDALVALLHAEGQEWWFLVVRLAPRRFQAARFEALRARISREGDDLLRQPLREVGPPLVDVAVIDRAADEEAAIDLAAENEAGVVVVVDSLAAGEPEVIGVVQSGLTRGLLDLDTTGSIFSLAGIDVREGMTSAALPEREETPPPAPTEPSKKGPPSRGAAGSDQPEPQAVVPAEKRPPTTKVEGDLIGGDKVVEGDVVKGDKVAGPKITFGDVSDSVVSVGDGTTINVTIPGEREETREQLRRFEAAVQREAHVDDEIELQVAVLLPDAPSPFGAKERVAGSAGAVGVAMPVDRKTGELKPVDLEVSITAPDFMIIGKDTKTLTVWPDGRTEIRWFMLKAKEEGKGEIRVEVSHEGRLIDQMRLSVEVFSPQRKARGLLNLSLNILSLSLQLSFAAG